MLRATAVASLALFALGAVPAQSAALAGQAGSYPSREACYRAFNCIEVVGGTWFCPTPDSAICEDYPPEVTGATLDRDPLPI